MFMDLDTRAVFAPLTKWNAVVHDPRRMPELARRAFREALSGRPGPVHLDVPQDVLSARRRVRRRRVRSRAVRATAPRSGRARRPQSVDAAVQLLRGAKRPLVVAGGGVVTSGAAELVREIARRLGAPVVPTQMALGVVASDSPHFIGHGGLIAGDAVRAAFDGADVVLSVGCRFSSWMWDDRGPFARRHHRTININIDPSALGHPALHEVAMQADAQLALDDLLAALDDDARAGADAGWLREHPRGPRRLRSQAGRDGARTDASRCTPPRSPRPSPMHCPPTRWRCSTAATPPSGATTSRRCSEVRTRFHEPGMSHLGFGLPYAHVAAVAAARRGRWSTSPATAPSASR